jgi:hypothetical protein
MGYDVSENKTLDYPADEMIKSASEVISRLGGKASKKSDPAKGRLEANFNKSIKGEFMNNRVQLEVSIASQSPAQCTVTAEAYPVDPVGMKLMFGVQGKPARRVIDAFFTELDAQLKQ